MALRGRDSASRAARDCRCDRIHHGFELFGGTVGYGEMLGYLPVMFFGAAMPGPMHSVAILFWVLLFPGRPGQMTAFGLVMHNFFLVFNAAVGLLFLRRATREVFW